jgi:hypothetical protein
VNMRHAQHSNGQSANRVRTEARLRNRHAMYTPAAEGT